MSVSSADFLAFATGCHSVGNEINYRNCVSRAYYGVFHAARPVGEAHCPDPNAHLHLGDHERLHERFKASTIQGAKPIGYVLKAMKDARHRADYDIDDTVALSDATQSLANAQAFASHLANFRGKTRGVGTQAATGTP